MDSEVKEVTLDEIRNTIFNQVPSNDSEVIAEYLDGFKYDFSKSSEVLEKYDELVKKLKP